MLKSNCLALLLAVGVLASPVLAQDKEMPGSLLRSSHVVGMEVRNAANENLGDIKEVVLDREKGTIAYAVISFGGFLNVGDKFFAVPWESLKPSADKKAFVLDIQKDRLEKAPGFNKDQWPNMADPQFANELKTFWGTGATRTETGMGRPEPLPAPATGRSEDGVAKTDERGRYPDPNRDDRVFNRNENDGMGTAGDRKYDGVSRENLNDPNRNPRRDDRMLDRAGTPQDANRQQIVTRTGTIRSFTRGNNGQLVLTTSQGDLNADLGSVAFLDQNQLRFDNGAQITVKGYETFRDGRNTFVVTEVTSNERTVKLQNDGAFAATDGTFSPSTTAAGQYPIRDLSGTVTHVESSPCEESGYGRQITIRTADGDRVVALAPGDYLDNRRWIVRPNDTVSVRGYEYDRHGGRVFIATELRHGSDTWTLRRADLTPVWANR